MTNYTTALKIDNQESTDYFNFSISKKTEQQKALEKILLEKDGWVPKTIADIACGGGGASLHLSALYPQSAFTMIDASEDAIALARQATRHFDASCSVGDIYNIALDSNSYDLVVCWQTLSWLDRPKVALRELVRICKPGGFVIASSLFNLQHDVDVYAKVIDHTRPSSQMGMSYDYNTYSLRTVEKWVSELVSDLKIHEFSISIDLENSGRGIGTYTVKMETGERLQCSAGMLLNWGILEAKK
jgi:ubiquinone/menaquinone biosynthesis C-methylase UbiE